MHKFDAVIEAVRYKNGRIDKVRLYERRGATFSDRILLDRKTLLSRLQAGQTFVTGRRKELWASTFEVGKTVTLAGTGDREVVTTLPQADHDELEGVPAF